MASSSFFYSGTGVPDQITINELIADLEAKVVVAKEAQDAATLAAEQAASAAANATVSQSTIQSLLTQAQSVLVQAQAAQAAAETALSAAQAAINITNNNVTSTDSAKVAAQAAQALAETAAANAQASQTAAAASQTAAATSASAASTSASGAATSATNAASSASAAASSATAAASSATSAASNATSASGSASTATTQATAALSSANSAATSATASANSATASASSATASAASATASAASLSNFKAQYLGPQSVAPTVDGNGNALSAGDIYFDTTLNQSFVYGSAGWTSLNTTATPAVVKQNYVATAGQTTFTVTGGYIVGNVDVFINGVRQFYNDFTATNGTTVVLAAGAALNDEVSIVSLKTAIVSQPVISSAATDEFITATAYDQYVKMNVNGAPYYVNASIAPTLDFKFSSLKTLQNSADGSTPITFTRATTGTFFDASGVLQTAASGAARFTHDPSNANESLGLLVEPQATNLVLASDKFDQQNLLTQSGTFSDSAWVKTRCTVTGGQSDPFGGTGAFKLAEDSATGSHFISTSATSTSSTPHVVSFYAKAAERSWVSMYYSSSTYAIAYFDLQNGVVGTASGTAPPTNLTITSVGSGWYRCSMKFTSGATGLPFGILASTADNTISYTGTTGSGVLIYGAQIERTYGTTPSAYYATTSTAFAPWVPIQTTLTPSAGTAPDGTNSAYKVVAVSGQSLNTTTNFIRTSAISSTLNATYTISAYAKASGYNTLNIRLSTGTTLAIGTGAAAARFNLSTGTVTSTLATSYNANIQSVGNGWYRCSVTSSMPASTIYGGIYPDDSTATTANGTDGVLLWGFQVESGESATTYIKTTNAQATRNADVVTIGSGTWLNQNEGTFYTERKLRGTKDQQTLFSLDNGTIDIEAKTVAQSNAVNLLTRTNEVDAAIWTKAAVSIIANSTLSPDGLTVTADKSVETIVLGTHYVQNSASHNAGTVYTFSVYLKAGERTRGRLQLSSTIGTGYYSFDLSAGTITLGLAGATSGATIASVGNGWYRASLTYAPTSTAVGGIAIYTLDASGNVSYTGDGTSGFYVWGSQIETGSSVSTYEPNPKLVTSYEIGSTGLIQTGAYADQTLPNYYPKSTFGYKLNDATYYRGGSSVGTDTSVTLPTSMNRLVIGGSAISSGREINGTIKRLTYWPLRLTNTSQTTITS